MWLPPQPLGSLGRAIVGWSERLLGWSHRNQRIVPTKSPVKVNLGSGLYVAPGWINIDGSLKALLAKCPAPLLRRSYSLITAPAVASAQQFVALLKNNLFIHHDLKYGIPLPDRSADFIYSSHMLHHLYYDQAVALLKEAKRVLKPGGTIRIAVPDLEYIISLYQRGQRQAALGYFFYPSVPRGELSTRRYQYDFVLLRNLLLATGFEAPRRCAFATGTVPDLSQLDRLPEETLYVEAQA